MLSSTPFESSNNEKLNIDVKRNSYTIIDSIKEEPLEKPSNRKKPEEESHSFHSNFSTDQNPKKIKDMRLYVPLSHSFNLNDSNDDEKDSSIENIIGDNFYPAKNDEILLKSIPKYEQKDTPTLISRTPSPIPNSPKEKKKSFIKGPSTLNLENVEDENLLHLLPLDPLDDKSEGSDKVSDYSPNIIDDKNSNDSEYDNYHKFFDNLFLIQPDKKSNEEEKKSAGSIGLLNESSDSKTQNYLGKGTFNSKLKTDQDILMENRQKYSQQQNVLQKIELDIQKNADSNYKNTIKNIESQINFDRNDHKHISLPPSFMSTNAWGNNNFSETPQTMTPLNFLNGSQNAIFSPSPSSHFDRFIFNDVDNLFMTTSSNFPGIVFFSFK